MQEFGYPMFNAQCVMPLTNTIDLYPNMLMDITVHRLGFGESVSFHLPDQELAIVLIEGEVQFDWDDGFAPKMEQVRRPSCIDDPSYCLHVPKGVRVSVSDISSWEDKDSGKTSEILVQSTENKNSFEPKFYTPENTRRETFGQGQFEGKAERTVTTFFDYESAPYSNMVCGEILIPQGGWSSYPPHEHPQPEVYYYRFGHPAGFGACFIDDNVYMIKDRSFAAIPGGKYHPQVNAPGYAMMYVWMIRHFDGYPWTERNFKPAHQWLLEG
ncbi:MAG: 5-deoxy-glucuronate isomerase [Oscillospiraceae bacterium]|nr:5-deoxy-glucuronate isomerase [Oscillospiraceae bacterium]